MFDEDGVRSLTVLPTMSIWSRCIYEQSVALTKKVRHLQKILRSTQAAKNHHAILATRALARLGGYSGAPRHEGAAAGLAALLTPQLAGRLGEPDPLPLLRDLNRSVATPTVSTPSSPSFVARAQC